MKKSLLLLYCASVIVFITSMQTVRAAETDWTLASTSIKAEFNEIACPEPRTCFAVAGLSRSGGTGALVKTSDGGVSFSRVNIPTLNPLHGITCPTAHVCYSAGDFGTFLKTENGGETWTEYQLGSRANPPPLNALFALDAKQVFVVGKDGRMYRTRDGGAYWTTVSLRTIADLTAVYFINQSVGFVTGNDGVLLKTEDSGNTWATVGGLRDTGTAVSLRAAPGGQTLFTAGDSIRKSIDGGTTWTQSGKELTNPHAGIAVVDEKIIYVLAGVGTIFRTADGGAIWSQEFSSPSTILRGIACPTSDYCLAVGSSGAIFRRGVAPEPPPPLPLPSPEPVLATTSPKTAAIIPQAATATSTAEITASETTAGVTIPPAPPAPAPVAPVENQTAKNSAKVETPSVAHAITTFTRSLKKGLRGDDVSKLQEMLAGIGGVYPEATVSGFFGDATRKAVGRFQEKYGIAEPGGPGYGEAGPKTRAKLMEEASGAQAEILPAVESVGKKSSLAVMINRNLKKGVWSDEVKKLQRFLATDSELYPEGEVSGYFGPLTERAVGRFQARHGIAEPDDEGYGQVGPKTRAKIKEVSQTE